MTTAVKIPDYLDARQRFLRAMGLEKAQQQKMFELFGVLKEADLEDAMQKNPSLHLDERKKYSELGIQLDYCSRLHDLAKAEQRQKIALQQAELNSDIKSLEC